MFAALSLGRVRRRRAAPAGARRVQGAAVPRRRLGDPRGRDPAARRRWAGCARAMPVTFVTMTIGFAALAGRAAARRLLLQGRRARARGRAGLRRRASARGVARARRRALITAALTAAYATRAWLMVFFGPRRRDQTGVVPHESPAADDRAARRAGRRRRCWAASPCSGRTSSASSASDCISVVVAGQPRGRRPRASAFTAAEWSRLSTTRPGRLPRAAAAGAGRASSAYDAAGRTRGRRGPRCGSRGPSRLSESDVVDAVRTTAATPARSGRRDWCAGCTTATLQRYLTAVVVGAVAVAVVIGASGSVAVTDGRSRAADRAACCRCGRRPGARLGREQVGDLGRRRPSRRSRWSVSVCAVGRRDDGPTATSWPTTDASWIEPLDVRWRLGVDALSAPAGRAHRAADLVLPGRAAPPRAGLRVPTRRWSRWCC